MTALTALILTISLVGSVLVGLLYVRLREVDRTLQLKRHRAQDEALCDLLNYAAVVGDGVVIGKNGALIAGCQHRTESRRWRSRNYHGCVHHPVGHRAPAPANGGGHGGGRRP